MRDLERDRRLRARRAEWSEGEERCAGFGAPARRRRSEGEGGKECPDRPTDPRAQGSGASLAIGGRAHGPLLSPASARSRRTWCRTTLCRRPPGLLRNGDWSLRCKISHELFSILWEYKNCSVLPWFCPNYAVAKDRYFHANKHVFKYSPRDNFSVQIGHFFTDQAWRRISIFHGDKVSCWGA